MEWSWKRFFIGLLTIGISEIKRGNIGHGRKTKKGAEIAEDVVDLIEDASERPPAEDSTETGGNR